MPARLRDFLGLRTWITSSAGCTALESLGYLISMLIGLTLDSMATFSEAPGQLVPGFNWP